MVAETRAAMLDLAARSVFTEPGERVLETRAVLLDLVTGPEKLEHDGVRVDFKDAGSGTLPEWRKKQLIDANISEMTDMEFG